MKNPQGNLGCPVAQLYDYIHAIFKRPLRSDRDSFSNEFAGEVVIPISAWQPAQL